MALANSIVETGKLVSSSSDVRTWSTADVDTSGAGYQFDYEETVSEKVYEWVALTQSAAQTAAETADQSGLLQGEVASYVASEEDRVIGSYKLTKTITSKVLEVTTSEITPPE